MKSAIRAAAVLPVLLGALGFNIRTTLAAPPNGGGPPISGPGDPPLFDPPLPDPPFPCDPLRPAPGFAYTVQGQLTEDCGSQQPLSLVPLELHIKSRAGVYMCDPNDPFPQTYTREFFVAAGQTDEDGRFSFTFLSDVLLAEIPPNDSFLEQLATLKVFDPTGAGVMAQTRYASPDASRVYTIDQEFPKCLTDSTRIQVTNSEDEGVFGAELFVNGALYPEKTGQNGYLYITPRLLRDDQLVARARVHENHSRRGAHDDGSDQDWNFRAYITSLRTEYDSNGDNVSFSPRVVLDPQEIHVLQLNRLNAMIGLNMVLSLEWDASDLELNTEFAGLIREASQYLFNATDGQFFIEQVHIYEDKERWDEADWRVYADASLRASVDWPKNGFWRSHDASLWRSSRMHMSRRSDMPAYIHEFGHYGFQVSDEYVGGQCAHGTTLSGGPFAYGGLKASCMMYDPRGYTKICSDHVDNPHLTGTKQGDQDCWSELKGYFSDGGNGPGGLPRWILRTPVDRGAIPGPMPPIPLAGWRPRITSHPVSYPNLCQPIDLQWIRNGSPVQGAEVQVRSPGGRWLTQGITGSDGRIRSAYGDPAPITGVHIGDKVRASFPPPSAGGGPFFIAQRTITEDDCVSSSVVLSQVPGAEPELIQVELTAQPFDLRASLEPTATQGVARIRVRAATQLSEAPRVQFALSRDNQPRNVTVDYDANTNTYIGLVDELPYDVDAIIEVTASDDASRSATCVARASMSLPDTSEESEVLSSDGQLVLTIPAVGLPAGTYVTISPAPVGPPALDGNAAVVSGPYEIRAGDSSLLGESASLRFRLPFQNGDDVARSFDPDTFEIRRYDAVADAWIAMDGAYESHDPSVVTETTRLGSFVLIAGSVAAAGNADSENQNSGSGTGAQSSNAGGGSGPCGSGAALLTPLMLACLGIRSRRKVRAVNR